MNPYQPPAAENARDIGDNPTDRLWHVSAGQLRVRDGATLPNVCLSGAAPGEPGERKTLVFFWCPLWAGYLPAIAISIWMLWTATHSLDQPLAWIALIGIALSAVLCWRLSKRIRLHLFQSHQAKRDERRRGWIEAPVILPVLIGSGFLMSRIIPGLFEKGSGGLMGGLFVALAAGLITRRSVRACEFKSGWFLLTNVHPAAIARLEEIARRLPTPRHPTL